MNKLYIVLGSDPLDQIDTPSMQPVGLSSISSQEPIDDTPPNPVVSKNVMNALNTNSDDNTYQEPQNVQSSVEKFKQLYPQGYQGPVTGDVTSDDIYPNKNKNVVAGYTSTPSWGSQPLWDIGVNYPLGIYYKNQAAITSMMLNAQKTPKPEKPEKLTPETIQDAAPNFQGAHADIFMNDLGGIQSDIKKNGGMPADVYYKDPYTTRYQNALTREKSRAYLSNTSYKNADDLLKSNADEDKYVPVEAFNAAKDIKNTSDYDFRKIIKDGQANGLTADQSIRQWYDERNQKIHQGVSLGHATANLQKGLTEDVNQAYDRLTPDEKKLTSPGDFYKSYLTKNVSDGRLNALATATAQDSPNDFYVAKPGETEQQAKDAAAKEGKTFTTYDLVNNAKAKLGITTIADLHQINEKQSTADALKTQKETQAVSDALFNKYKDAVTNPGNEVMLDADKNVRMVAGTQDVTFYRGDQIVSTYRKNDATGIMQQMNTLASNNRGLYGSSTEADIANHLNTKSGSLVMSKAAGVASNNPYTLPDDFETKVNAFTDPSTRLLYSTDNIGSIPLSKDLTLIKPVATGMVPLVTQGGLTDNKQIFHLQVKQGNNIVEGVMIPSSYKNTSGKNSIPVGDKNILALGANYKPNPDGNTYSVIGSDGKQLLDSSKNPISLPASYVQGIGEEGISKTIQAHKRITTQGTGVNSNTTNIGSKPINATTQDANDLAWHKYYSSFNGSAPPLNQSDFIKAYQGNVNGMKTWVDSQH